MTTYRNTTTYTSRVPGYSTSEAQGGFDSRYGATDYGSRGSTNVDSRYESSFNRRYNYGGSVTSSSGSSSTRGGSGIGSVGFGQTYHKNTEEELTFDYEEEEYDPAFERGPVISLEDRTHPLVVRGFGVAPGRAGFLYRVSPLSLHRLGHNPSEL